MPAKRRKTARVAETPSTVEAVIPAAIPTQAPTPEDAPERGPDVFDEVIAARAAGAAEPATQGADAAVAPAGVRAYQPDPFAVLSVAVDEGADAPRVRLFRNRRMNQVAVGFDKKPPEPVRQRLRDEGYKWRDAEGVWTKQLGDGRAAGQLAAERLVAEVGDAIRAENGLAPVGRAEGR